MLKLKMADLPLAELFASASAVPGLPSTDPGKTFRVEPPNDVRSGVVPCGLPNPKADTSNDPVPIVAGIVAGVAVETVVAGRFKKSQAAMRPLVAGATPGRMMVGRLLLPEMGTSRRARRLKSGAVAAMASRPAETNLPMPTPVTFSIPLTKGEDQTSAPA